MSIFFKDGFTEADTLKEIEDIADEYSSFKKLYRNVEDVFGAIKLYNITNSSNVIIEFDEFESLTSVIKFVRVTWELLDQLELKADIRTYSGLLTSVEVKSDNSKIELKGNTLISEREIIESVIAYDLYGRVIESFENIHSNSLNLSGLKGALILQVETNNSIHSIKYFSY